MAKKGELSPFYFAELFTNDNGVRFFVRLLTFLWISKCDVELDFEA
jgi:hypothetical protein